MTSCAEVAAPDVELSATRLLLSGSADRVRVAVERMASEGWQILGAPVEGPEGVWGLDAVRPRGR